jgi:uncharacterized protein (DUF1501 family)
MKKRKHHLPRRKFIKQAALAGFGLTTFSSTLFQFNVLKAAALSNYSLLDDEYKAMVCIFLNGGSDSFNMLMPRDNASYKHYSETRSNLAIPQDQLLSLNTSGANGQAFGVNPAMKSVQNLFNDGKLAFLTNIGSMVEPVTRQNYDADTVNLPLGLFSHSDQTKHWQTAIPHERASLGWAGRIAELLNDTNNNEDISMNISLSGSNILQHGQNILEFTISPSNGASGISGYGLDWGLNSARTELIDSMLSYQYDDLFKKTYVRSVKQSVDAQEQFQSAIDQVPGFNTSFSNNSVSESFEMIAKVIAARETLGFKKQIFFIQYGGWDHHNDLLENQEDKLNVLSNALGEFAEVLEEIGMMENVVTATMSEFGRTLTSNGNGSDHAWGGNVMVMGGAVKGRQLYGEYPNLELGNNLDIGRGRLIPTMPNDLYFAELALWFGVPPSELPLVLPNIGNFYDVNSGQPPLGFAL